MKIEEIQNFFEAFDTKFDYTKKIVDGNEIKIYGNLNNEFYEVNFKLGKVENLTTCALSFSKIVDGLREYNLIDSKNRMAVLGAVKNIIAEELPDLEKNLNLKILVFFLQDSIDKRAKLYKKMFSYGAGYFDKWHIVGEFNLKNNSKVMLATKGDIPFKILSLIKNRFRQENLPYWFDLDLKKSHFNLKK